jgi:hypothetical protein
MAGLVPGLVPAIHAVPLPANPRLFWRLDATGMTGTSPIVTALAVNLKPISLPTTNVDHLKVN